MTGDNRTHFGPFIIVLSKFSVFFLLTTCFSNILWNMSSPHFSQAAILTSDASKDQQAANKLNDLSNWQAIDIRFPDVNETEWTNPCSAISVSWNASTSFSTIQPRNNFTNLKILRQFRNVVTSELQRIKRLSIHIGDMHIWRLYEQAFEFLPRLPSNNCISMKRWHHHLQIYVAYFGYLRQIKLYADAGRGVNLPNKIAAYLQDLRRSAQAVLCNLEYALHSIRSLHPRKRQLLHISSHIMKNHLQIQDQVPNTWKKRSAQKANAISTTHIRKVNPLNLKFLKAHFLKYLRRLNRILRIRIRKYCVNLKKHRK